MRASASVDELGGDAELLALPLDAALEHVAHIESPAYLADIDGLAQIGLGRVARDYVHVAEAGKVGDDVLGDAAREPGGRLVDAEIVEREDGDRGFRHGRLDRPEVPDSAEKDQREHRGCGARAPA